MGIKGIAVFLIVCVLYNTATPIPDPEATPEATPDPKPNPYFYVGWGPWYWPYYRVVYYTAPYEIKSQVIVAP
ncbi:hypothetical protein GWI33_015236 [Rhynchophorus ferrugineus]|uniref:Uncharacterized protein n=1 Tax=Rhynchophorus ferrugineus TaxID=354439 RepID=A0A834I401_RHYFE|nr:hypothetical protein GWI33_015236 [Rhynchophorus ferrugineus]